MTMDPTVSFGTPVDGKPFELTYAWEDEQAVLFLTATQLRNLVASGDAALVEHRQATCGHELTPSLPLDVGLLRNCIACGAEVIEEADGSVVPVGEGTPRGVEVLRDDLSPAYGTSLRGYIDASYNDLLRLFGPSGPTDGYKEDAQWVLRWPDGFIATVYNYKNGPTYLGEEGLPVEHIRDWHVGGFPHTDLEAVDRVLALLAES